MTREMICSSATSSETGILAMDTAVIFAKPPWTLEMDITFAKMPIQHVVLTAVPTASKDKSKLHSR